LAGGSQGSLSEQRAPESLFQPQAVAVALAPEEAGQQASAS
jgi:hypothetical protein